MATRFGSLAEQGTRELFSAARHRLAQESELKNIDFSLYLPLTSTLLGKIPNETILAQYFDECYLEEKKSGSYKEYIQELGLHFLLAAETCQAFQAISSKEGRNYVLLPDDTLRKIGIGIIEGTIAGIAIVCGTDKNNIATGQLVRELRKKGMLVMLDGEYTDSSIKEFLEDDLIVLLGNEGFLTVRAFIAIAQIGILLGRVNHGDRDGLLKFFATKFPAFVISVGQFDSRNAAISAGALALGVPVVSDQELSEEEKIEGLFESTQSDNTYKLINLAIEMKEIKLKQAPPKIPIEVNPAFEGEIVRKHDTWVEFGGNKVTAFELLKMVDKEDINDGQISIIGPEIDEITEGSQRPFGIIIKVYGRKMQQDFVGIMERRIHYFISYGEGLWHTGGRDSMRLRISKPAKSQGLRIRDIGELLMHMYRETFGTLASRIEIIIYTDPCAIECEVQTAREIYTMRDLHLKGLSDEMVDTFYSCTLCQSHSPNHVCILTPEHGGLCGAVTWLDAKASYEMSPVGPNQPICKGECLDATKGMWKSVNEYMCQASNRTVEEVNLYSFIDRPVTSCGCFEAVMAVLPLVNGIMITARDYFGETPSGMTFAKLMGTCGGGIQIPGFLGVSRRFITSAKFIPADGGLTRVVWMSKDLKESLRLEITERARAMALGDNFVDCIADETIGITEEEILPFLLEKKHPALGLPPIM
jgi:acetyl-CoA synthase